MASSDSLVLPLAPRGAASPAPCCAVSLAPRAAISIAAALVAGALGCTGNVIDSDSSGGGGTGGGGSTSTASAHACPDTAWGKGFADPYMYEYGESVAVDADCNVVVAGSFGGVMDLGGAMITGADEDVFVARFDGDGHHLWSKSLGIEPFQGSAVTAVAPSGDVVLAGTFGGSIDFGKGAFNAPEQAIYLARFDASGKPLWAHAYGGSSDTAATHVAVDAAGAIFLTGQFTGFLDFGAGQAGVAGATSAFVTKVSPDGKTLWTKAFSGVGPSAAAVAVDATGFSLVTGRFQQKLQVGSSLLTGQGGTTAFVARLDPMGQVVYSRALSGSGSGEGSGAAMGADGNAWIAGSFDGGIDLGDGEHAAKSPRDGFLLSLDPSGATRWARVFSAEGGLSIAQIAAEPGGGAWLTGAFEGSMDLGTGPLASAGSEDGFVAAVDATGTFVYARALGGPSGGADVGMSVAVDPDGNALVTGTFQGPADLGSGSVQSAGGFDVFLAKVVR